MGALDTGLILIIHHLIENTYCAQLVQPIADDSYVLFTFILWVRCTSAIHEALRASKGKGVGKEMAVAATSETSPKPISVASETPRREEPDAQPPDPGPKTKQTMLVPLSW